MRLAVNPPLRALAEQVMPQVADLSPQEAVAPA
jgi:hypothetical protein